MSDPDGYRLLAQALEAAAGQKGKLAKIELLAGALRGLAGARLAIAARLLSGSPFAEWEQQVTSAGWATLARAAAAVTGWDLETIGACAGAIDLGRPLVIGAGKIGSARCARRPPVAAGAEVRGTPSPPGERGGLTIPGWIRRGRSPPAQPRNSGPSRNCSGALPVEAKYRRTLGGLRTGADVLTVRRPSRARSSETARPWRGAAQLRG